MLSLLMVGALLAATLLAAGSVPMAAVASADGPAPVGADAPVASLAAAADAAVVADSGPVADPKPAAAAPRLAPERAAKAALELRYFEHNIGQDDPLFQWIVRGEVDGGVTSTGLAFRTADGLVRLDVKDAQPGQAQAEGTRQSSTFHLHRDAPGMSGKAMHADRVRLADVRPGIDLVAYIANGGIEFDFEIAPGADPSQAVMVASGAVPRVEDGMLVLGELAMAAPFAYQQEGRARQEVPSGYAVDGQSIGFTLGQYDADRKLIIDPVVGYGTYIKGGALWHWDWSSGAFDVEFRPDGSWVVAGSSSDAVKNPHITHALNPAAPCAWGWCYYGQAFVIEFDQWDNLKFMAVWGAADYPDGAQGVSVEDGGHIYVSGLCGWATCPILPVTANASPQGSTTAYYTHYVGHFQYDEAAGTLDVLHMAYISGYEWDSYSPTRIASAPDGSYAAAGTTLGCPGIMQMPITNSPYGFPPTTCGNRVWIAKWGPDDKLLWLGTPGSTRSDGATSPGTSNSVNEYFRAIDMDDEGNVYIAGITDGSDLPTTAGALQGCPLMGCGAYTSWTYDHFYGKLDANGIIEHMSYWGTTGSDWDWSVPNYMDLEVIAEDEILLSGAVAGSNGFYASTKRPVPAGTGSWNGYVSHIHLDTGFVPLSFTFGSGTTAATGVGYHPDTGRILVGGYTDTGSWFKKWVDQGIKPVPQAGPAAGTDGILFQIDPGFEDATLSPDRQLGMIRWGTFWGSYGEYDRIYDVESSDRGEPLFAGIYHDYTTLDPATNPAPYFHMYTTSNALDALPTDVVGAFAARVEKASPIPMITARDGLTTSVTDPDPDAPKKEAMTGVYSELVTKTWTDVWLEGGAIATEAPINEQTYRWDLDGDGVFDDSFDRVPKDPLVFFKEHEQLVCLQVDDIDDPGAVKTGTRCMRLVWENRAPIPVIQFVNSPPFNRVDPVWFDSSTSFDLDGTVDWTTIDWDFGGVGTGTTGSSAQAVFQYRDLGEKVVTLKLADDLRAVGIGTRTLVIENLAPKFECSMGGKEPRVGGWLAMAVTPATDRDGRVSHWELAVTGQETLSGSGAPPTDLQTSDLTTSRFGAMGPGQAALTVWDSEGGSRTCTLDFDIQEGRLLADFARPDPAWVGVATEFRDRSYTPNGAILEWSWDFGDGTRSFEQHPVHTYIAPGVYDVKLTAWDGFHRDSTTKKVTVTGAPAGPAAAFTVTDAPYLVGGSVTFTNTTRQGSTPITMAQWAIEGPHGYVAVRNAQSMELSPDTVHDDWPMPGVYRIVLSVQDANGLTAQAARTIEVVPAARALADFTMSKTTVVVDEQVLFRDASVPGLYDLVEWEWEFQDTTPKASGATIVHQFAAPGEYPVAMTVRDESGARHVAQHTITVVEQTDAAARQAIEGVGIPPIADAGPDRTVTEGLVVRLDGSNSWSPTVEPLRFMWSQTEGPAAPILGAGTATPTIQVPYLGREEVLVFELTVTDSRGVTASDPVRLFVREAGDDLGALGQLDARFRHKVTDAGRVVFTAPSQSIDATFEWDFGDGSVAYGPRVQHRYDAAGTYPVALAVMDGHGRTSQHVEPVVVGRGAQGSDGDGALDAHEEPSRIAGMRVSTLLLAGTIVGIGLLGGALALARRR